MTRATLRFSTNGLRDEQKLKLRDESSWRATACARRGFCRSMLERAISLSKNASRVFCKFSARTLGEKPRPGEVELGSNATRSARSGDPARAEADGSPTSNRLPTTYCAVQHAGPKSLARVGRRESLKSASLRKLIGPNLVSIGPEIRFKRECRLGRSARR